MHVENRDDDNILNLTVFEVNLSFAEAVFLAIWEVLRQCVRRDIPVVFATGKHRGPWVQQLLSQAESKSGERSAVCVFFLAVLSTYFK